MVRMPNHKEDYHQRNKNNTAEDYFDEWAEKNNLIFERFGFDQLNSNIQGSDFGKIPKFIRNRPDYVVIGKKAQFVEVKGGTDKIRMKQSDLKSYSKWNEEMELYYFFYSSQYKTHKIIKHEDLLKVLKKCDVGQYHDHTKYDKKLYYKIDWIMI